MARPKKEIRNKDIVDKYLAGQTMRELASYFNVHFTRIKQILDENLPKKNNRSKISL